MVEPINSFELGEHGLKGRWITETELLNNKLEEPAITRGQRPVREPPCLLEEVSINWWKRPDAVDEPRTPRCTCAEHNHSASVPFNSKDWNSHARGS